MWIYQVLPHQQQKSLFLHSLAGISYFLYNSHCNWSKILFVILIGVYLMCKDCERFVLCLWTLYISFQRHLLSLLTQFERSCLFSCSSVLKFLHVLYGNIEHFAEAFHFHVTQFVHFCSASCSLVS